MRVVHRRRGDVIAKKATIIAVTNQKGGTGKTTTCENLGIGLAMEGKKVLLVDADPQGSLTISMGWQQPDELPTTLSTFALDGIRAEWKIYCIRSAYYIYKNYGSDIYQEALKIIVEAWWGDSDSFLSGILHGVTRFVAMYRDEYSRERLIARLSTVHPKTITKNARKDTGNTADRHMKQILEIYNGSSRSLSLPVKR